MTAWHMAFVTIPYGEYSIISLLFFFFFSSPPFFLSFFLFPFRFSPTVPLLLLEQLVAQSLNTRGIVVK